MTQRRALIVLLLLPVVLFLTFFSIKRWQTNAPARAYAKLELGMGKDDVIRAIGAVPGDYYPGADRPQIGGITSGPIGTLVDEAGPPRESLPPRMDIDSWHFSGYSVFVWFDGNGEAIRTELVEVNRDVLTYQPNRVDRLLRWLGL